MEEKLRFVFEHERQERAMTELFERYEITRQQPIANFTFSASSQIRRLVTVRRGDCGGESADLRTTVTSSARAIESSESPVSPALKSRCAA